MSEQELEEIIKTQNFEKMESLGIIDYYFELIGYINNFIGNNYKLSEIDFKALVNNETTKNIEDRANAKNIMKEKMIGILINQAKTNQKFSDQLNQANSFKEIFEKKATNYEEYKKEIFEYKQDMLESLHNYKTKTIQDNEDEIKELLENGISGEAIESTLEDMINKSDEYNTNPKQVKEVVETIVDMKENINEKDDATYASEFVNENSSKIKDALSNGLAPEEISKTLEKEINSNKKTRLPFMVKLISKIKRKELKLNKNNTKEYQKVKVKVD